LQIPRLVALEDVLFATNPQSILSVHVNTLCGPFTFLNFVLDPAALPTLLVPTVALGKPTSFLADATKVAIAVTAVALEASLATAALGSTGRPPASFFIRTVICLSLVPTAAAGTACCAGGSHRAMGMRATLCRVKIKEKSHDQV